MCRWVLIAQPSGLGHALRRLFDATPVGNPSTAWRLAATTAQATAGTRPSGTTSARWLVPGPLAKLSPPGQIVALDLQTRMAEIVNVCE